MRILGVDPGVSGALVLIETSLDDMLLIEDMPTHASHRTNKRQEVSASWLADILRRLEPDEAWVERVHALPGQGVSSSFSFGQSFGIIRGVLGGLQVPTHLVTPNEWKRRLRLTADKSASRAMAVNLFPANAAAFARVKDDGRAEAALIAWFGLHDLRRNLS